MRPLLNEGDCSPSVWVLLRHVNRSAGADDHDLEVNIRLGGQAGGVAGVTERVRRAGGVPFLVINTEVACGIGAGDVVRQQRPAGVG